MYSEKPNVRISIVFLVSDLVKKSSRLLAKPKDSTYLNISAIKRRNAVAEVMWDFPFSRVFIATHESGRTSIVRSLDVGYVSWHKEKIFHWWFFLWRMIDLLHIWHVEKSRILFKIKRIFNKTKQWKVDCCYVRNI